MLQGTEVFQDLSLPASPDDVVHQARVEGLACQVDIVLLSQLLGHVHHFEGTQVVPLQSTGLPKVDGLKHIIKPSTMGIKVLKILSDRYHARQHVNPAVER